MGSLKVRVGLIKGVACAIVGEGHDLMGRFRRAADLATD